MTINLADNTPRVSYAVAEGVTQTSFTVSFEFFDDADLNVYVDETLKTLTTDYTVTGGDGSTGTVTISVTGASGGSTVVITRDIDLKRTTDFPASGAFQVGSLNTELDKLVAIAADLDDKASRALQLTDYDTAVSLVLPDVDTRKGTVLAFDSSTGAVTTGPTSTNVNTLADVADDIATLADIEDGTDATDAIQTVAGVSSNVTTVASNISSVNTAASNITDIQNASANAATATTKAAEAATSATNAATSATSASTAQTAAETAQTGAETAQTAAESARDSALAAYDNFDDRYLGVKASDPTLDNDGNALVAGALYFNSTDTSMKVYDGSDWYDAYADGALFARKANNLSDLADAATALTNLGLTATAAELNALDGITATVTELNYTDGVTSAIQTQLDSKFATAGGTLTGAAVGSTDTDTTNTGSVTLDFGANQNFVLTLTGNVTLDNPTTEATGQSGFIVFIQDATGGRTVSLGTDYETAGGAGLTLSTAASTTDIVPYVVAASGRILLGTPQLAFA
jgi:hypothetical protein